MMSTFAAGATRLAGLIPRLLGWRPDDVWSATPAELAAIFAADAEGGEPEPLSRADLERMLEHDLDG